LSCGSRSDRGRPLAARAIGGRHPAFAAEAVVALKNVSTSGGVVSGAIENHGALPVKDVKLLIQQSYRWPDERKPGAADPGRSSQLVVADTIQPGGRATFKHDGGPLPTTVDGGSFETTVQVLSFDVVTPPTTP
jgi:hypothetical protein